MKRTVLKPISMNEGLLLRWLQTHKKKATPSLNQTAAPTLSLASENTADNIEQRDNSLSMVALSGTPPPSGNPDKTSHAENNNDGKTLLRKRKSVFQMWLKDSSVSKTDEHQPSPTPSDIHEVNGAAAVQPV